MSELLIDGYIRKIEQQLSCRKGFNNIIPININNICYLFYHNPTIIYISSIVEPGTELRMHTLDVSNINNPVFKQNMLSISETIDLQDVFKYKSSYCFIPDIFGTSSLKQLLNTDEIDNNEIYDTVFIHPDTTCHLSTTNATTDWKWTTWEFSLLFLIFKRNHSNDESKFHIIKSSKKQSSLSHIKYCDQYGIIAQVDDSHDTIYQLKLNGITDSDFELLPLTSPNGINSSFQSLVWGSSKYLTTHYLPRKQALFSVKCSQLWAHVKLERINDETTSYSDSNSTECYMYTFELDMWTSIATFNYNAYKSDKNNFECGLCTNYNVSNKLYLVSNIGHTSEYDFKKDKWYHL
eukprot:57203_1